MKWVIFRLIIHVFISFYNVNFLCFIFQELRSFFISAIIYFVATVVAKNKCWLCLFSKNPWTEWGFLPKYVTVFSSIIDVLQGSKFASHHDTVTFSNQNSLQNQFFLENCNKKEDLSYEFTCSVSLAKDLRFYKYPLWFL